MPTAIEQSLKNLEQWQQRGRYYRHEDNNVFYISSHSDKPCLLLLHGFPTSSWDYSFIWQTLSSEFNLIAIDMLGFGLSDKPANHSYSSAEQANIIEAILRHENISELHILAHDYGDTVTQELLARHGQKQNAPSSLSILSVCFLNGGLFPESHGHTFLQGFLAGRFGFLMKHLLGKEVAFYALRRLFGYKYTPSIIEFYTFWKFISYNQGHKISHKLLHYIAERKRHRQRWVDALKNTDIAIRLINGPEDPVSGINMVENYKKNIEKHDVVLIEGAGHFPHIEAQQEVIDAYLNFYHQLSNTEPKHN